MPQVRCPQCGAVNATGAPDYPFCVGCQDNLAKCGYCRWFDPELVPIFISLLKAPLFQPQSAGSRGFEKGNRDEVEGKVFVGNYDEFVPDGGARRTFRPLWWRTWRYLQVTITTATTPSASTATESFCAARSTISCSLARATCTASEACDHWYQRDGAMALRRSQCRASSG